MQALMQIAFKGDADAKASAEAEVELSDGLLQIAESFRHIRQHVTQHSERSHIELKLALHDFVKRIRVGVVPVRVKRLYCLYRESGHSVGRERTDVPATTLRRDPTAVDSPEQCPDFDSALERARKALVLISGAEGEA
jgi:hypothetical protein